jgi:hypothetical protein
LSYAPAFVNNNLQSITFVPLSDKSITVSLTVL